jgi:tetratricopeptide (TPR) repeat protein
VVATRLAGLGLRDEALDRVEGGPPHEAWLEEAIGAYLATLPFLRAPSDRLERIRARLLAWDPGPVRTEPVPWNFYQPHDAFEPHLRTYLLARVENRLGRNEEALRLAGELEAMGGPADVRVLAADFARQVRGQVALDDGRPEAALRAIEEASFWEATSWDERPSPILAHDHAILLRAQSLYELGRYREAIRWYEAAGASLVTRAYRHFRTAQAYDALGERGPAAEHYAEFVRQWAHADADLRDLADHARRRLEALAVEG